MIALAGLLAFAAVAVMVDIIGSSDSDEETETWDDDQIRVTAEGEEPELLDPEVFEVEEPHDYYDQYDTVQMEGYQGTDQDELIETNIHDDVTQDIVAGDGLDVIRIGLGDDVQTLSDHDLDTHEEGEEESGDRIILELTAEDTQNVEENREISHFKVGSDDVIEIVLPEGFEGKVAYGESLEYEQLGGGGTGASIDWHEGYIFLVEDPDSFPDYVEMEQDQIYMGDYYGGSKQIADVDGYEYSIADGDYEVVPGVTVIGIIDLGQNVGGGWLTYSDQDPPDLEPGDPPPPGYVLSSNEERDPPTILVNGEELFTGASLVS